MRQLSRRRRQRQDGTRCTDLTDDIWLFGNSREAILESISTGRGSGMPTWVDRLDPVTIKALAVYVHSLGGGK